MMVGWPMNDSGMAQFIYFLFIFGDYNKHNSDTV
jgi:hypothetical protein